MITELTLPSASSPGGDPSALWTVQLQLMMLAEHSLGPRDASKTIYQPVFADEGPFFVSHRILMERSPN